MERSRGVSGQMAKGVEFLFKKNKVDYVVGKAQVSAPGMVSITEGEHKGKFFKAKAVLLATGCKMRRIPGLEYDGVRVMTSREALANTTLPKSVVIVGAGAIGVEFAYFYNAFGSKVTLVEMLPQVLPVEDEEVSKLLHRSFEKQGITVLTGTKCENFRVGKTSVKIDLITGESRQEVEAEVVLSAIGVVPNLEGALNGIFGHGKPHRVTKFPGCTYCQPQVASTGLTEQAAREKKLNYKVGKFPFAASGKAVASAESDGFVKVITDAKTGEIYGAHIIGAEATELIAEYGLAMELEATVEEVHKTIHAHPTLSEAVMEAAAAVTGEAIHI
jgi:dihydrolipoamide dehydrogenase